MPDIDVELLRKVLEAKLNEPHECGCRPVCRCKEFNEGADAGLEYVLELLTFGDELKAEATRLGMEVTSHE